MLYIIRHIMIKLHAYLVNFDSNFEWLLLIHVVQRFCAYFDLLLAYHLILHWQYSFSLTSFLLNFGQSSWMQTVLSLAHFVDLISSWIWSLTTQLRSMETKRMTSGWWWVIVLSLLYQMLSSQYIWYGNTFANLFWWYDVVLTLNIFCRSSGETVLSWLKHSNQLPRLSELSADLDVVQPLS